MWRLLVQHLLCHNLRIGDEGLVIKISSLNHLVNAKKIFVMVSNKDHIGELSVVNDAFPTRSRPECLIFHFFAASLKNSVTGKVDLCAWALILRLKF